MNETTIVRGDGVAAACCVRLLTTHNMPVATGPRSPARPSAILLSEATQSLLGDLFTDRHLFRDLPRITRRIVIWGPGARPVTLPHSAIAIREQDLLQRLWARLPDGHPLPDTSSAWKILSARRDLPSVEERQFGARTAFVSEVRLADHADRDACWTESLAGGWLFLFPVGDGSACLIAVGATAAELLAHSTMIAKCIVEPGAAPAEVPAYPRILSQLSGDGWLACGSAAMAFDPLCGEGAANAVREAILAAAVVYAVAQDYNVEHLLEHYNARLMTGFLRHLQMCQSFYASGGRGPFWRAELDLLQQGASWLTSRLKPVAAPRFRLVGFQLQPIPA